MSIIKGVREGKDIISPFSFVHFSNLNMSTLQRNFGPWVYPMGSIVIALSVSASVSPSIFKYLGDCPLVFSETLHEVRAP